MASLFKLAFTIPAIALGSAGPTLTSKDLSITLDTQLPRPLVVKYLPTNRDLSPPTACPRDGSKDQQDGPPEPMACAGILSLDGNITRYCASCTPATKVESSVQYSVEGSTASWIWRLEKDGAPQIMLTGSIKVGHGVFEWNLDTAVSSDKRMRAVDLNFAMAGVYQGGKYLYTTSQKTWCPPGTGCQEWSFSSQIGTVGQAEPVQQLQATAGWNPPDPLPFAEQVLFTPGRSNSLCGWTEDGSTGIATWSSQHSLPYQLFLQSGDSPAAGFGTSRINTNLRCGDVLPFKFRMGIFQDLTQDRIVDADDGAVWTRRQYPAADWIYRSGLIFKIGNDYTSYKSHASSPRITFNDTLRYIEGIANISDSMLQVMHLVGWQGSGHDTLYPSLNRINPLLGTSGDLQNLFDAATTYNAIVSYHANTDEAYENITATDSSGDPTIHPAPGTDDGLRNPDFDINIIAKTPSGDPWIWQDISRDLTDPLQGPSYHISKAKDAATGQRWKRLDAFLDTVPLRGTLHSDAYRDIDVSFEDDERGFIAEDEEMACGCVADSAWLHSKGLSFGVEGANGMASAGGPTPPVMGIVDYYWHGSDSLGTWGRLVMGSSQGLDDDIVPGGDTDPLTNWNSLADRIYLQAKVYAMQMTDLEKIGNDRFVGGGDAEHWPYGGDFIKYRSGDRVFVPAVVTPTKDSPKDSPTKLNPWKVYVYERSSSTGSSTHQWVLPANWQGKVVEATTITPTGRVPGPELHIDGRSISLDVSPARPVILTVHNAAVTVV